MMSSVQSPVIPLDPASRAALRDLATDALGEFTIVAAAIALLHSRLTGEAGVAIATPPLAGIPTAGKYVVLPFAVPAGGTIRDYLAAAAEVVEAGYESDSAGPNTAVPAILIQDPRLHEAAAVPGVAFHYRIGGPDGTIGLESDPAFVDAAVAEAIVSQLGGAIGHFRELSAEIGGLDFLDAAARCRVVTEFNCTEAAGLDEDVILRFERQVRRFPDSVAVIDQDGAVSYADLNRRAELAATALRDQYGMGPETMAGILMNRSVEMVAAVLGILKCGAAFVPLDLEWPEERIRFIAEETRMRVILADSAGEAQLRGLSFATLNMAALTAAGAPIPRAAFRSDSLAYVIYTSGSTGQPKGCQMERSNLANYLHWAESYYFDGRPQGIFGLFSSLSSDFTLTCLLTPLIRGDAIRILPNQDIPKSLAQVMDKASGVNFVKLTPSHIRVIEGLRLVSTGVTVAIIGGDELTPAQVTVLRSLNPAMEMFSEYGPTETTVGCIVKRVGHETEPILIGRPIANARAYVLDSARHPLPIGVRGEIWVGGAGVGRGYLNRPDLTADRFRPSPFVAGERIYRTGDIGSWTADGELQCFGRSDGQVKTGGYRVEIGEVETAIRRSSPAASAVEGRLTSIWRELFEIPHVGIDANLFALGADSLTAARLVSRIWKQFAVEIGIDEVFSNPTIAEQAVLIQSRDPRISDSPESPSAPAAEKTPVEPLAPTLSYPQRRMWFLSQLEGAGAAYNISAVLRLRGGVALAALEWAFGEVVRRHESLRTIFPDKDGAVRAEVLASCPFRIAHLDFSGKDAAAALQAAWEETARQFRLDAGPLFRVAIIRQDGGDHLLAVSMHHIISDGWSMNVLIREVTAFYGARVSGAPVALSGVSPGAYRTPRAETAAGHLAYWTAQLRGAPELLEIPADRPRPSVQTYRGGMRRFAIDHSLTASLTAIANASEASLFMVLLAGYAALLSRYSRQNDIVIGVPVANRNSAEAEGLIGLFVNVVALRIDLEGEPDFDELVRRVKTAALAGIRHQDVPFEQIVGALDLSRDTSHSPVFQVMFTYENTPRQALHAEGLEIFPIPMESATAKFDLTLYVEADGAGLAAGLEYNSDLFDAVTIDRMAGHFMELLAAIGRRQGEPVAAIPMLTPTDRAQLAEWNSTGVAYELRPVHYYIEDQVARTPDAIAVSLGAREQTFRELNARANQLAHYLMANGIGRDTPVGVCMERSFEMVVSLLGILKAGAAYVPIDPDYPPDRVAYMIADCRMSLILTHSGLLPALPPFSGFALCLDSEWDVCAALPAENPERRTSVADLAYIIYTSGSTGGPKGAMNEHGAVCNRLLWMRDEYGITAADRILQKTPFSFDVSVWEFFLPLITGARLVLAKPGGHRDPRYLVRLIREAAISTLHFVPSMLRVFLEESDVAACASLRRVICSGEALPYDLQEKFFACSAAELHNLYGPTEAAVDVTAWRCRREADRRSVPIGLPIANTRLYIADADLRLTAVGVPGELLIGGVAVGRGYWNRDELTAQRFVPDPFAASGGRLYRTGDLARYRADGAIEFLGRIDHQVKIRGFRIEPAEIENVLRSCPGVRDCVVTAPEERGLRRLVAYVATGGSTIDEGDLRTQVRSRLPEYMTPSVFVFLAELPLLPNGKLNRRELPAPVLKVAAAPSGDTPKSHGEALLSSIWCDVLGLPNVRIDDNFFSLGGDSILGMQVVARARQAGLHLAPTQIFEFQTVAQLALAATRATPAGPSSFVATGQVPLSPIQRWFLEQAQPDPHYFNQSVLLTVPADVDKGALAAAVRAVRRRHAALRVRFAAAPGGWRQSVSEEEDDVFSEATGADWRSAIAAAEREINLAGPIMRVCLLRDDDGVCRLFIVIHHLAVDAISWTPILEDLQSVYGQIAGGEVQEFPAPTASYEEWSTALELQANAVETARELAFWLRPERTQTAAIPVDRSAPAAANRIASARSTSILLNGGDTRSILTHPARAYSMGVDEVLLAAVAVAVRGWTGCGRVLADVEGHGRNGDLDVSRSVGWFTSLYPQLLACEELEQPGEILRAIKEQVREVPNRGIGYGLLRYLSSDGPTREALSAMPPAEILFNYLGQADRARGGDAWNVAEEAGAGRGNEFVRQHPLEIVAVVTGGQLQVDWIYSTALHEDATVRVLAGEFEKTLLRMIHHCEAASPWLTPSDVPAAHLPPVALNALLDSLRSGSPDGAADVEDVFVLSPMQQGMLFHTRLLENSESYFEQMSCTIRGELDRGAFRTAWEMAISSYPALRTTFHWADLPHAVQVVHRSANSVWQELDWSAVPLEERDRKLEEFLRADRAAGFSLSEAPPLRFTLIQLDANTHRFCWSHHHALLDGWSVAMVLRFVTDAYEAGAPGPILTPPFRRYIDWQQAQDAAPLEQFWRRELAGFAAPAPLRFVSDHGASPRPSRVEIDLSATLSAVAVSASQALHTTLNTLLMGAWALTLARYTGADDIVFGLTVAGRPSALDGVEEMAGLFINTVPARVRIERGDTVAEWLMKLQARSAAWIEHSHAALVDIQRWSDVSPGSALFECLLVFEDFPEARSERDPFRHLVIDSVETTEMTGYPLTVAVVRGESIHIRARFDESRISRSVAMGMLALFQETLEWAAAGMHQKTCDAPPAAASELRQINEWNARTASPPFAEPLHQAFARHARTAPERPAVVCGDRSLSYRALNELTNRLAFTLRAHGAKPEGSIALLFPRSVEMIVALLAVLKSGAAYVPIDPAYPAERVEHILADAGALLVICDRSLTGLLSGRQAERAIFIDTLEPREGATVDPDDVSRPDHLAYLIYTSGTAGTPKGVMIEHRSLSNLIGALDGTIYANPAPGLRIGLNGPLAFDTSVKQIAQLACGHTLVVVPDEVRLDPAEFLRYAREQRLDSFDCTPVQLESLLTAGLLESPPAAKRILVGGEAISRETWRRLSDAREIEFFNVYGPTEATVDATAAAISATHEEPHIGRPIPNVTTYILDAALHPVPIGAIGELYIGGAGVGRGYRNNREPTERKFMADPFQGETGARMYATGDRARYCADGTIEYLGRNDRQVKVRGYRVELAEIEAALERVDGVRRAVVRVADGRIAAFVIPETGRSLEPGYLRREALTKLPARMVPSQFGFLDRLPLTSHGKIDFSALPGLVPSPAECALDEGNLTPYQARLLPIWREILGQPSAGIDDDFFALGGHSILAMQLMARVESEFGRRVPIVRLFENPTVASLAESLESSGGGEAGPLVAFGGEGDGAPVFLLPGAGGNVIYFRALANLISGIRPVYGLQSPGMDGSGPPLRSLESIARVQIDQIRRVQATGPYTLAGHSFGGKLAFEMAQQLRRQGEEISLMIILDTPAPSSDASNSRAGWTEPQWLAAMAYEIGVFLGRSLELPAEAFDPIPSSERIPRLLLAVQAASPELATVGEAALRAQLAVYRANFEIEYTPPPEAYRIPIVLFQATDEPTERRGAWGWEALSEPAPKVFQVPGDHLTMLLEPNVRALARELNLVLRPLQKAATEAV